MRKKLKQLAAFLVCLCVSHHLSAQNDDSLWLDLGRIRVRKDFTQSVTIKGSDLQRMPFALLTDAVNAWFQGSLSYNARIVYVIDGNLVNNVNNYSIHDIEEITLVQNALAQLNGAMQEQQLVLIKTRSKGPGTGGINIAGSGFAKKQFCSFTG